MKIKSFKEFLSEGSEYEEDFEDIIRDTVSVTRGGFVNILGLDYLPSRILKLADPIAYRMPYDEEEDLEPEFWDEEGMVDIKDGSIVYGSLTSIDAVDALLSVDKTAYRVGLNDYADSRERDEDY